MSEKENVLEIENKKETSDANATGAGPYQERSENLKNRKTYIPRTDIYETDQKVYVLADMPGVDEKTVDINVEKNTLTISGSVNPQPVDGHSLVYSEYEIGDYTRRFTLTNDLDLDNIEASLKDGVLRLFIPKVEPATKKIAVRAG